MTAHGRALLFLYGAFKRDGEHTDPSNIAFDASLRDRNAEWGVRDVEAVQQLGDGVGLGLMEITEMPANNLMLTFAQTRSA